jgi:DNA-binding IclR family transcriptional regulator
MGQLALPFLRDLSRALGETVDLSVARGSAAVFIEQVLGSERLAAVSHVGDAFPLHNTANGRALLGCLKPAERARLLRGKGRGGAPDEAAVEADVAGFLVSGLAYDRGEHTPGISAVGTAFLDPFGQPFALSVPMPTERFAEKLARVEVALLATRAAIVNLAKGSLPQPG